jgi:hypothetical protein
MIEYNPFAKVKPIRTKQYREFITTIPCLACSTPNTDPHHEPLGSSTTGGKPSDLQCLPLCRSCHTIDTFSRHKHPKGWKYFYWAINVDPMLEMIKLINFYLAHGGKF